jgi:hypothetical protein
VNYLLISFIHNKLVFQDVHYSLMPETFFFRRTNSLSDYCSVHVNCSDSHGVRAYIWASNGSGFGDPETFLGSKSSCKPLP